MKFLFLAFIFSTGLASAAASANGTLLLGSWNIHSGEKAQEVERELQTKTIGLSNVLTLQETNKSPALDYADIFAEKYNYSVHREGSNAILSKFPITARGKILVHIGENRLIPWVDLAWGNSNLRVYSVHLTYKLGWNPFIPQVRCEEMQKIIEHAVEFKGAVIIAGDFNTVGRFIDGHEDEPALGLLKDAGYQDALQNIGGPTHLMVGRVDWIFFRGSRLVDAKRGDFGGSDHRWIQAALGLR